MRCLRKTRSSFGFLAHCATGILLSLLGCGPSEAPGAGCPTHPDPSFQIGTGEARFVPIQPGDNLQMVRGLQGGCHFVLAFLTDGFEGRATLVEYRMDNLTDGQQIIVSQQFVRLRPATEGRCQATDFIAFLVAPWNAEDDEVRIEVTLEEDTGVATQAVEGVARWPEPVPGIERDLLCGER